jgi:hypothetical protein
MTLWQRFLLRIGRCPYCRWYPTNLEAHLEWSHASRRREWEGMS